ncbi:TetR/AcrR family transcriptional regulator [Staphylococcus edaphicus]|uniref:TetR family transcriptional regulator n=1 Tax=Staphylococcus edaphicus TaxID=1955013 RepID=A0A2C6WM86_9STAP|nr:TetR/AcrR family transcriptional regulator [Staphylococcus edaphicus]PHK48904.1 TetR family transcriptional regulator [Staphylococcus edaphicus]UQW81868.1 TetR/AcrR family transcriptional regulator [Staphylococcus edaphicus]
MNEKDLRVIKTKRALSQNFFSLLEKQEFSSITVNQICNAALIHRTTFYKHFYDKYDLLIYLITELTEDYFSIDIKDRINNPFTILDKTMTSIIELHRVKERQSEDKEFERTIANHFIRVLQNDIKDNEHRILVEDGVPMDVVFYIYGASLFGFMEWIREHHIDLPPQAIDEIFHKMVNIKVKDA